MRHRYLNKFQVKEKYHKSIFENWVKSGWKDDFKISPCNSFVCLLQQICDLNYNLTSILLLVSAGFPSPRAKEHLPWETEVLFHKKFWNSFMVVCYEWHGKDYFFLSEMASNIPSNLIFCHPKRTLNLKI